MLSASVSVTDKEFSGFGVTWDWEQVTAQVFQDDKRPIILFDGVCNLCNGGVNFALDHDAKGECRENIYYIYCNHTPLIQTKLQL